MSYFKFGPNIKISHDNVFASSDLVYSFVNLKPVVPGHVLVATKRDVTADELVELHQMAQKCVKMLEKMYPQNIGFTIVIQDGAGAGQSVPSVHVHVMPRKPGDFERNDDVYAELERDDKTEERTDSTRQPRDALTMKNEAESFRHAFRSLE